MNSYEIITGEKIQEIADIYLGDESKFQSNPRIRPQQSKHIKISDIHSQYDNPKIIYFYTDQIIEISKIIDYFKNPFILISHNSDENIRDTEYTNKILNSPKLIKWYSQNICFRHPKLELAPIGLANSMWPHGNLSLFNIPAFINNIYDKNNNLKIKQNRIFFNFNIHTNPKIRQPCFNILSNTYPFLPNISPQENLIRLSTYQFCISPEGNGSDCHRLWEALYLKVVPIVLKTPFTETLIRNQIPLVILEKWEDLKDIEPTLNYNDYDFSIIDKEFTFSNFSQKIKKLI